MEMDWATAVYQDAKVTEMGCAMESISSGNHRVDCITSCMLYQSLKPISSHIILLYNELHTLSFPSFDLTRFFRDFVDPHCWVVSHFLTLFLRSSSQKCSFSRIPLDATRDAAECQSCALCHLAPPVHYKWTPNVYSYLES